MAAFFIISAIWCGFILIADIATVAMGGYSAFTPPAAIYIDQILRSQAVMIEELNRRAEHYAPVTGFPASASIRRAAAEPIV